MADNFGVMTRKFWGAWKLLSVNPDESDRRERRLYSRRNFFGGVMSIVPPSWPGGFGAGNMTQMRTWVRKYPDKGFLYEYYRDL